METSVQGIVVMTTTQDPAEADRLAEELVRQGLAACVQTTAIRSHYLWEGKLEQQAELLLLIKTIAARYEEVEAFLRAHHSYSLPEIAMLPMTGGSASYLDWLGRNAGGKTSAT
jgi:periplasmic divalent cation tolerance protein